MGVLYSIFYINDEVAEWLSSQDIPYPLIEDTQQPLTPAKILRALEKIEGIEKEPHPEAERQSIQIELRRWGKAERTTLMLTKVTGPDEPCSFYFSKGDEPLIEAVLAKFAAECGPLVLYPDYGADIRVITADGPYPG